jgi:hypothetical protein
MSPDHLKPSAASVITKILLSKKVPTDKKIIERVLTESRSKNFDRFDLAWYKTKARQGKLKGQDGTRYVIQQKQAKTFLE